MKMNQLVTNILMATALTVASSAASAVGSASERPDEPLGNSGFYAGFEFGYAPVSGSSQVTSANGMAFGGRGGYAFNRNVSAEVALDLIGNLKTGLVDWSADVLSASMVGYYPIQDELDVYGKLGYASANVGTSNLVNNVSKNKTGLAYGFGVELGHGKKNSIRLGMDHYDLSAWSAMPISANNFNVSFGFRF
jgi:opacity protein-like surface antigen